MGYHYIALVDDARRDGEGALQIKNALEREGMEHKVAAGRLWLFTSHETPTLLLHNGCILIGRIFLRDGTPVLDDSRVPTFSSDTLLRRHILENYWGDYIFIQPASDGAQGLTVMRDPSGGVPCVYSLQGCSGFLTSDISLVTKIGLYQKRIDWDYINSFLTYPQLKTRRTGLLGINELLPGCTLQLTATEPATERAWSPWHFVASKQRHSDPLDAAANVRRSVISAVKAWAETDRSVLLEMSGGLDSSIIAACLREARADVACCTLVTPLPGADERQYANLIAKALGVELRAEMLEFEHARFDFPPPSSTASPRIGSLQYAIDSVVSAVALDCNATSSFTGAGGDTVFCFLTNASPAADAFRECGLAAALSAIRDLSTLHRCTLWTAAHLTLKKLLRAPKAPRSPHATFVHPARVASWPDCHPWFDAPADALPGDRERVFGLVDTQAYRDMTPRGARRWLRMPLLAQPVVEACLRTPSWMWIAGGQNRAVARTAFADMLPAEILNRRSKGNFVSYLGGFYSRNKEQIRDFLLSGSLNERRLLNVSALSHFLNQADLPTRDHLFLEVFDLCMVENWTRHQN